MVTKKRRRPAKSTRKDRKDSSNTCQRTKAKTCRKRKAPSKVKLKRKSSAKVQQGMSTEMYPIEEKLLALDADYGLLIDRLRSQYPQQSGFAYRSRLEELYNFVTRAQPQMSSTTWTSWRRRLLSEWPTLRLRSHVLRALAARLPTTNRIDEVAPVTSAVRRTLKELHRQQQRTQVRHNRCPNCDVEYIRAEASTRSLDEMLDSFWVCPRCHQRTQQGD